MSTRMDDLLVLVAGDYKAGISPMSHEWLVANAVTYDECLGLAENIATAIHVYRAVLKDTLRLAQLESGEKSLAGIVEGIAIRQSGPMGILLAGIQLEDQADIRQPEVGS